jgi:hypothetical protein
MVDVLRSIQEGDAYFFSPRQVAKGFIAEPAGYPIYMVRTEDTGEPPDIYGDYGTRETFYVNVYGIVHDEGDVVTPMEHAIQDVREAIMGDFAAGGLADSLTALVTSISIDTLGIEYDSDSTGYSGRFSQRFRIQIDETHGKP